MAIDIYAVGQTIRESVAFTDAAGAPVNPSVVKIGFLIPDGAGGWTETIASWPPDGIIVNTGAVVGAFHSDRALTASGDWYRKWRTTTPDIATSDEEPDAHFVVIPDRFPGM